MKKFALISAMMVAISAVGAWADCDVSNPSTCVHGALTITEIEKNGKKCYKAVLNDSVATEDAYITIDQDIENICEFEYNRDFSGCSYAKPTTVMLPFDSKESMLNSFAQIFKLDTMSLQNYNIKVKQVTKIEANNPFFLRCSDNQNKFVILDWMEMYPLTLKATNGSKHINNMDKWEFTGTYSYKKWEEGDPDLGYVYGFAAKNKNVVQTDGTTKAVSQGQFVKGKAGAFIKPARAYLIYNQHSTAPAAPPFANSAKFASTNVASIKPEDLPDYFNVIFEDENGETTSITRLNTKTGDFSSAEGWFDMKGRKLDKKPTMKGSYFYNGKKVVIK